MPATKTIILYVSRISIDLIGEIVTESKDRSSYLPGSKLTIPVPVSALTATMLCRSKALHRLMTMSLLFPCPLCLDDGASVKRDS